MTRRMLKTAEDFQTNESIIGVMMTVSGERVRIVDRNYENDYGSFILCESIKDQGPGGKVESGEPPDTNNLYEIAGTLHIPGYSDSSAAVGYYIENRTTKEVKGYSVQESTDLIFREGASNAQVVDHKQEEESVRFLEAIDELPGLESQFWKIPAYKDSGELHAPLSDRALDALNQGLITASKNLAEHKANEISIDNKIDEDDLHTAKEDINQASKITVLTGAGVSTMSGIPDYRSVAMGMWQKDPQLLEYLNEETFQRNPALFWEKFYELIWNTLSGAMPFANHQSLLAAIRAVSPNVAHYFFRWLESDFGKEVAVVTQNVDRLHQKAGSRNVIEFHGNVLECVCRNCGRMYNLADVLTEEGTPRCEECEEPLRPDAVFFGDPVKGLEEAVEMVENADLVIVAGTSLQVHPFSSLVNHVAKDAKHIYINGESPENPGLFDVTFVGNLSEVSGELRRLLEAGERPGG